MAVGTTREILVVEVGGRAYGIPSEVVRELIRNVSVSWTSLSVRSIGGVIDLRGEVMPVIDLRQHLGMPGREPTPADHLVIARKAGGGALALRVDRALELSCLELAAGEAGGGTIWARHPEGLIPVLAPEALVMSGGGP